jgi:hypothetical protein
MVDRDLMLRKVAAIDEYLAQLTEYRGVVRFRDIVLRQISREE